MTWKKPGIFFMFVKLSVVRLACLSHVLSAPISKVCSTLCDSPLVSDFLFSEEVFKNVIDHISRYGGERMIDALRAKGNFETAEEAIADLWEYNSQGIYESFRKGYLDRQAISQVSFIVFGRSGGRLTPGCTLAIRQLQRVIRTYLDSPPIWKFLPTLFRQRYTELFTDGPEYDILKKDLSSESFGSGLFAISEKTDARGSLRESWEAGSGLESLMTPGIRPRLDEGYVNYVSDDVASRTFYLSRRPHLRHYIDLKTGRSVIYHVHRFGDIYFAPSSRLVVSKTPDGSMLHITHAEAAHSITLPLPYLFVYQGCFTKVGIFMGDRHISIRRDTDVLSVSLTDHSQAPQISSIEEMNREVIQKNRMPRGRRRGCSIRESPERVWFTVYDMHMSMCHQFLRMRKDTEEFRAMGGHPRQERLRRAVERMEEDGSWERLGELVRGMFSDFAQFELLGLIYGDGDCVEGRFSADPEIWKFGFLQTCNSNIHRPFEWQHRPLPVSLKLVFRS